MKISILRMVCFALMVVAFASLLQLGWAIWRDGRPGFSDAQMVAMWIGLTLVAWYGWEKPK